MKMLRTFALVSESLDEIEENLAELQKLVLTLVVKPEPEEHTLMQDFIEDIAELQELKEKVANKS